jgi:hypothetical protein
MKTKDVLAAVWPPGTRVRLVRVWAKHSPALKARLGQEGVVERFTTRGTDRPQYLVRFGPEQEPMRVAVQNLVRLVGRRPAGPEVGIPPNSFPVRGYETLRADRDGEIWQYGGRPQRWRRCKRHWRPEADGGCYVICMAVGGIQKERRVASLVLFAFGPPRALGDVPVHFPDTDPHNCRPDNLRWGPRQPTNRRPRSPDTFRRGSELSHAILHEEDIPEIRQLARDGFMPDEIAELKGVCKATIHMVLRGDTWRHVPDPAGPIRRRTGPPAGPDHPDAALSADQLEAIRAEAARELAAGHRPNCAAIGRKHGVRYYVISNILTGKSYQDGTPPLFVKRPHRKLTMDDAREIRRIVAEARAARQHVDMAALRARFGISDEPLRRIIVGLSYKDGTPSLARRKLTLADAQEVRRIAAEARAAGRRLDIAALGARFGVGRERIRQVLLGRTYKDGTPSLARRKFTLADAREVRRIAAEARAAGQRLDRAALGAQFEVGRELIRQVLLGRAYVESPGAAGQDPIVYQPGEGVTTIAPEDVTECHCSIRGKKVETNGPEAGVSS